MCVTLSVSLSVRLSLTSLLNMSWAGGRGSSFGNGLLRCFMRGFVSHYITP